jgi:hypothetical protein
VPDIVSCLLQSQKRQHEFLSETHSLYFACFAVNSFAWDLSDRARAGGIEFASVRCAFAAKDKLTSTDPFKLDSCDLGAFDPLPGDDSTRK